jgi:transcriptional regulator with XRE-family HTH domain
MVDKLDYAEWLQDQLNQRGWTQAKLATESGVSAGAISKTLKRRSTEPEPGTLRDIAEAFKVAPATLFRMMDWLPQQPNVPELDDVEMLMSQMSPEMRATFLEIGNSLLKLKEKRGS